MITSSPTNGDLVETTSERSNLKNLELSAQLTLRLAIESGIRELQDAARELLISITNHVDGAALDRVKTPMEPTSESLSSATARAADEQPISLEPPAPRMVPQETVVQTNGNLHSETRELSERDQRDARLKSWAELYNIFENNAFRVQGRMLKKYIHDARPMIGATINSPIEGIEPEQIAYRILNTLVHAFDPQKHGGSFSAFLSKYFNRIAVECKRAESLTCVPDKPNYEVAKALLDTVDADTSINTEIKDGSNPLSVEANPEKFSDLRAVPEISHDESLAIADTTPVNPTLAAVPVHSAAEIEQERQANMLMYIRESVPGADQVWDSESAEYTAALETMFQECQQEVRLHAETILGSGKEVSVVNPAAVHAAMKEIFTEAIASCNPSIEKGNVDQFKQHFIVLVTAKIKEKYAAHNENPEDARRKRVINYLKTHVPNVGETISIDQHVFNAAVTAFRKTSIDQLQSYAIKVLKNAHKIKTPKTGAAQRALEELFNDKAFPTFDPPDDHGDRFRGHFTKVVDNHISDAYERHKHN